MVHARVFHPIYDVSFVLGGKSIDYAGNTPSSRDLIWTIKDTGICDLSKPALSAHSGTHVDSPAHFMQGGKMVDQYSVADFIHAAHVIHIENRETIRRPDLEDRGIEPRGALLLKMEYSGLGRCRLCPFLQEFVYLSVEVAAFCMSKKIGIVGMDYITIEKYGDRNFPSHHKLLGNGLVILEVIDLDEIPAGAPAYPAFS